MRPLARFSCAIVEKCWRMCQRISRLSAIVNSTHNPVMDEDLIIRSMSKRDGDGKVTLNVKGHAKPLPVSRADQALYKQM